MGWGGWRFSPPSSPTTVSKRPWQMSPRPGRGYGAAAVGAVATITAFFGIPFRGVAALEAQSSRAAFGGVPSALGARPSTSRSCSTSSTMQASNPSSAGGPPASRLVVGLGNPGAKYERTRHNIGFLTVDTLVRRQKGGDYVPKWDGLCSEWDLGGGSRVYALKPQTFMNLSGRSLSAALTALDLTPLHSMTIIDDVNLPFGQIRVRDQGSAGGHNGLKDVQAVLETDKYARMRIGVGPVPEGSNLIQHVLGDFAADEQAHLPEVMGRAAEVLELWAAGGAWDKVVQLSAKVNSIKLGAATRKDEDGGVEEEGAETRGKGFARQQP